MNVHRISIWFAPKGAKSAAEANAHRVAPVFHAEPINIAEGRYLLRYPIGPDNGLDGSPVKAERAVSEPAFQQPDNYDVFLEGDPVNAWTIDRTWFNAATGLELFLKRPPRQKPWHLWQRSDSTGIVWELADESGTKVLEGATMSAVLIKLTQAGLARIVCVVSVPDPNPGDHLVVVER